MCLSLNQYLHYLGASAISPDQEITSLYGRGASWAYTNLNVQPPNYYSHSWGHLHNQAALVLLGLCTDFPGSVDSNGLPLISSGYRTWLPDRSSPATNSMRFLF